jgi:hypothetical protein
MKQYYKIVDGETVFFSGNVLRTQEEIDGEIQNVVIYNPTEEMILAAGWMIYEPPVEPEPEPTEEELTERARENKLMEIDTYDNSRSVNIFYLAGQPLWLDAQTRQTLRISIESYQTMGIESVTKWFNDQQYTFPTVAWLQMLVALEVYAAEALNVTEAHRSAVRHLTSRVEIDEYDVTVGYPEPLNLSAEALMKAGSEEPKEGGE